MRKILLTFITVLFVAVSAYAGAYFEPDKLSYQPNEKITIRFYNFPGNNQDWMTIVPVGSPAGKYKEWFYTGGKRNGQFTFKGLPEGKYEVRGFFNWPTGRYNIRVVSQIVVQDDRSDVSGFGNDSAYVNIRFGQLNYRPGEPITVYFDGMPGNKQDWITIVPEGTPANKYKQWFYTHGKRNGALNFNGLPAGKYELRVYYNWPSGGYNIKHVFPLTIF